jgi:hypothetical protein
MPDRVVRHHPWNLGIEIDDSAFIPIVGGDWRNPARGSLIFTTFADNQTRIKVHVLQGESNRAVDNRSLAKLELTGITPAPKGVAQIEVTFDVTVSGTFASVQVLPNGPRSPQVDILTTRPVLVQLCREANVREFVTSDEEFEREKLNGRFPKAAVWKAQCPECGAWVGFIDDYDPGLALLNTHGKISITRSDCLHADSQICSGAGMLVLLRCPGGRRP